MKCQHQGGEGGHFPPKKFWIQGLLRSLLAQFRAIYFFKFAGLLLNPAIMFLKPLTLTHRIRLCGQLMHSMDELCSQAVRYLSIFKTKICGMKQFGLQGSEFQPCNERHSYLLQHVIGKNECAGSQSCYHWTILGAKIFKYFGVVCKLWSGGHPTYSLGPDFEKKRKDLAYVQGT